MIISSISYKGGVGKTTAAQNLGVAFAHNGYKVCIIDSDETGASAMWSGIRAEREVKPQLTVVQITDAKAFIPNVQQLYEHYDVIIVDGPPSLFPIVSKIILISHLVLIPITPTGGSDLWVTQEILERYLEIQQQKEDTTPAYFLVNRYDPRINLHRLYLESLQVTGKEYGVELLDARLHNRIVYGEANAMGMGVIEMNDEKATAEVTALYQEVMKIAVKA
jgi:chromosome partitioning protein